MNVYGLIGRTLTHSFSKDYFTKKFQKEAIPGCIYRNFELQSIEEFPLIIKANPDLRGLNVTIPYKEEVLQYLDQEDEIVSKIKACNCIKIEEEKLIGYNTDVTGFQNSLTPYLKPHHTKALILGTGGASKAIQFVLEMIGLEYYLVSRRKQDNELGYEDLGADVLNSHTLIINTTPLGMYPNIDADPPIHYGYLSSQHLLVDLIYNPLKTKFLQEGEKRGAEILNGYDMLVIQAEESWKIWNS